MKDETEMRCFWSNEKEIIIATPLKVNYKGQRESSNNLPKLPYIPRFFLAKATSI